MFNHSCDIVARRYDLILQSVEKDLSEVRYIASMTSSNFIKIKIWDKATCCPIDKFAKTFSEWLNLNPYINLIQLPKHEVKKLSVNG